MVNTENDALKIPYMMKSTLHGENTSSTKNTIEVADCIIRDGKLAYNASQSNTLNNPITIQGNYPGGGTYTDTLTFSVSYK